MKPDDKQIALMAQAALDAAMDKAHELGLHRIYGLMGIERAMTAVEKFAALHMLLGDKGMSALGKSLQEDMAKDAVKQAEDILKGEAGVD